VDRVVVEPIPVSRQLNTLLDAEHLLAQRERLVDLGLVARGPDFH
jgi:hypothetical protein